MANDLSTIKVSGTSTEKDNFSLTLKSEDAGFEFTIVGSHTYVWDGSLWKMTRSSGVPHIADVGIISQRHNRFRDNITATWPGNDTFSVTFTTAQDVRRYRVLVTGGADGDYVKVTEDATNEAQAEAWLANPTASSTVDVEHIRVYTSTPDAAGSFIPLWSEWKELSKDTADLSLSRLDFLASAAGPFVVFVEAE